MMPGVDSVSINVPEIAPNEAQEGFEEFMVISGLEGGVTDTVLMGFVSDDIQAVANDDFLEANREQVDAWLAQARAAANEAAGTPASRHPGISASRHPGIPARVIHGCGPASGRSRDPRAESVHTTDHGRVDLGDRVVLHDEATRVEMRVQVVSPIETGVLEGDLPTVSDDSPLGRAIIEWTACETAEVTIGANTKRYTIVEVDEPQVA